MPPPWTGWHRHELPPLPPRDHHLPQAPRGPQAGIPPCPVSGMEFSAGEMRKHAADCKASAVEVELRRLYAEGALPA